MSINAWAAASNIFVKLLPFVAPSPHSALSGSTELAEVREGRGFDRKLREALSALFLRTAAIIALVCATAPSYGLAADDAEPPFVVSGIVTDENGKPIAGADVGLMLFETLKSEWLENRPFTAKAKTAGDGKFQLTAPRKLARKNCSVWARAKGYCPARCPYSNFVENAARDEDLRVALDAAGETTLKILDASDMPAVDADVTILRIKVKDSIGWLVPADWADQYRGRTNREGIVVFASLLPAAVENVRVTTLASGQVEWQQQWFLNNRPGAAAPHFQLTLPPVGRFEGKITASDPQAPTEIPLTLTTQVEKSPGLPIGIHGVATSVTDAAGQFVAPRLAAGSLTLDLSLPDSGEWRPQIPSNLRVDSGATNTADIVLARGIKIRGLVRKQDTGEGYPKYRVGVVFGQSVQDFSGMKDYVEVETDEKGFFTAYVPPGPIELRPLSIMDDYCDNAWWDGRARGGRYGSRREVPSDVAEFDVDPIDLVPAVKVAGKLIDNQGKPLNNWMVFGYPEAPLDADGRPRLDIMVNSFGGTNTGAKGEFSGNAPSTHSPVHWKVMRREENTYELKDTTYLPVIVSEEPLILQIEEDLPVKKGKKKKN